MTGFRPRFWPTVTALIMMAMTAGLGTWQVHRLAWKTDLLAKIAQRMNGPAVPLPARIDSPPDWIFRNVHVSGHFAADKALWLYGRTYDGKAGIHLLVPLIRPDGDPILVDRGFVPFDHGSQLANYEPVFDAHNFVLLDHDSKSGDLLRQLEATEINGVVRLPEGAGLFIPSNQPDRNIWYSVNMPDMSKQLGMPLAPVYIAEKPGGHPHLGIQSQWPAATGGTEGTGIRNEHLQYAIFWYSMTLVLAVIYLMSSRERPKPSTLR
jgi:surfeit locus 1 family protein